MRQFECCGVQWRQIDKHGSCYVAELAGQEIFLREYTECQHTYAWWIGGVGYESADEATRTYLTERKAKLKRELKEIDRCLRNA